MKLHLSRHHRAMGSCNELNKPHHIQAIQHLVSEIAADTHVSCPGCCIENDIGRLVLRFELGVKLLPYKNEAVGDSCACQPGCHAHQRKYEALQHA